jgi:hypothetical protein
MGPIDLIVHLAGFVAPALALGLFMALVGPSLPGGAALKYSFWMRAGILGFRPGWQDGQLRSVVGGGSHRPMADGRGLASLKNCLPRSWPLHRHATAEARF